MKKYVLFVFLFLNCISLTASHILGGEITWECQGSNQYVFTLRLYRDCVGIPIVSTGHAIQGPGGVISLSHDTTYVATLPCYNPSASCYGTTGYGTEVYVFKSAPQTFAGSPPPSGWEFSYTTCCRPNFNTPNISTSSSGMYISSYMYPSSSGGCNSSAKFISEPEIVITADNESFSTLAVSDNLNDSLYYDFVAPKTSASTPVTYTSGYSYDEPFPNPFTDSSNGPISINHENGLVELDVNQGIAGTYVCAVKVEVWRNYELLSTVVRDMHYLVNPGLNSGNVNASIDTSSNAVIRNGRFYEVEVFPGDTLNFDIHALDADFLPNGSPVSITFNAIGYALDAPFDEYSNFMSKAVITPVAPQSSFTNALVNDVTFDWAIANEHLVGDAKSYYFDFQFYNNLCPVGMENLMLEVVVKNPCVITSGDSLEVCAGDSVQLSGSTASGSYIWSPPGNISDVNAAAPWVNPSSSGYYYLEDPSNPGYKDSVYISVETPAAFDLSLNWGVLVLTDSNSASNITWHYNGLPFYYPFNVLVPFGTGDYYVTGKAGSCVLVSDTVSVGVGTCALSNPSNGTLSSGPVIYGGSLGVSFTVNQAYDLNSIFLPGLVEVDGKTGGYDLNLKIYDENQNELVSVDTVLNQPISQLLQMPVSLQLAANKNYTLAVSGDTGYAFSLVENVSLPSTPFNAGLTVTALSKGSFGQFPSTPSNYLIPAVLAPANIVDMREHPSGKIVVYPNPSNGVLNIQGLENGNRIEVIAVNGKVMAEETARGNTLIFERQDLPAGLYFIKIKTAGATVIQKVLFK